MDMDLEVSGHHFDVWLKQLMRKNKLKTWDELAKALYISRHTLLNWRSDPRRIDILTLAGIKTLLGDEDHSLNNLCDSFGIACKSDRKKAQICSIFSQLKDRN